MDLATSGSFANKSSARVEYKLLKVFKIDLVLYFTIWYSASAPTIHPPDLLGSPSDRFTDTLFEFVFKKFFFLFCNEILHTISFYKSLYLHEPSFFIFLKNFIQDY